MKHYIKIKIKTNKKTDLLLKLNSLGVESKNITYLQDGIVFDCLDKDLKRIKKYLVSYKVEKVEEVGIYKLKQKIKEYKLVILGLIFSGIVFMFFTNIIVKVNIIHQDKDLRELLREALEEEGVKPLSLKKKYQEYEDILKRIKNNYKDKIEWLEIDVKGMVIDVRVEERIIKREEKNYNYCHIVASKSGIIKRVLNKRGIAKVSINDYVQEGDILISGQIDVNGNIVNNVCSEGEVEAEVWYKAQVSYPLEYEEIKRTGKMRYNIVVNDGLDDYLILKSRVKDKEQEKKLLLNLFGFKIYLVKEYEVERLKKTYSEEEVLELIKKDILEKLNVKDNKNREVILQKVLQKSINNGKLDIDMFISVIEQIGEVEYYTVEDSEDIDKEYSGYISNIS